ncbi:MAG: flagellar motor switch protein FliG [Gemmatimonadota bacterium]
MDSSRQHPGSADLPHWQKMAVLMVALGQELAGELMRRLSEDEQAQLTRAIAELKAIPRQAQDQVLAEFEDDLAAGRLPLSGGEGLARSLLEQAVGPRRAQEIWDRLGRQRTAFRVLEAADPQQAAPYIRREHPQTIALILSQVQAARAAAILQQLPAALQAEVAHRIATLEQVSPEVLAAVESGLAEILEPLAAGHRPVEGARVAADILNRVGAALEHHVLERMDAADPEIAEQVRSRMFTFGDLARLREADMRQVLRNVDPQELLTAMKAADKGVLESFLKQMSERRRQQFLEDLAALPRMRLSEVEAVQARIVAQVRQLEEQGLVRLPHGDQADEAYV